MNKTIETMISQHGDKGSFTHVAPTEEMLTEAQEVLGFPIPEQFLEFLNTYGHGGIGFEVLGIGFDGSMPFLEETAEYREDGLPGNLLVVENCDEWLYCIDADSGEVVSWYFDDDPSVDYPCFDDYLIDRLNDAIENL